MLRSIALVALIGLLAGGGVSLAAGSPSPNPRGLDVVPVPGGNVLSERGARFAPDRVLVRFRAGVDASGRNDILQSVDAGVVRKYQLVPRLELLRVPASASVLDVVDRLSRNPNVEYAEPDRVFRIEATPDDPLYSSQWDMTAIKAPQAWDRTKGSPSVTVAVMDTGVDVNHPDLAANIWTNSSEIPGNGIDDDGNGYIDDVHGWNFNADTNAPTDVFGHGTHVAGTVGAVGDNNLGVTGVNWSVSVMPLKICSDDGFCNTSDEVSALEYAVENHAKIANASFGGSFPDPAEEDAIDAAGGAGLLYVAAAGNNASNNDSLGFYPAGYPLDNIISVAASTDTDTLAGFSNYGAQTVDLAAPGQGILSTMVTTGVLSDPSGYGYLSGTSMAAPHVAGAAALLWSEHPSWTMAQIRDRLLSTVQPMSAAVGKVKSCGELDVDAATKTGLAARSLVCVKRSGSGFGSVSSSPAGINCGSTCAAVFAPGAQVTLTATPAAGSTFVGWSGAGCSGNGTCVVSTTSVALVSPTFRAPGSPPGWTQSPLRPPASRVPFVPGSPAGFSFYRASISADGMARAKTIYNLPATHCFYDTTDTGGVFLERKTPSGWVDDGTITAPYVYAFDESPAAPGGARWTNCAGFGWITKLSADGTSLLVSQQMSVTSGPVAGRYRCAAFVYKRGAGGGWTQTATLFPPGVTAAGSTNPDVCNYFGTDGAISADGSRVAIVGRRFADVFVRGGGGWTHEQRLTFPAGNGCGDGDRVALSGDGGRLLAGDPFCEGATTATGRVQAYSRSGSTWTLETTLTPPEGLFQMQFGLRVALSRDGSSAVISGNHSSSLPQYAGAAWIYEHDAGGWHLRTRITAPSPQEFGIFGCGFVTSAGERVVCDAVGETVGSNERQGAVYVVDRPAAGWTSGATAVRAFATVGAEDDSLGTVAADGNGTLVDAMISADNNGNGTYPNDRLGYEFTVPPRDGTGTLSVSPASVRSNTSGNTLTFTYTAATGGISNGAVAIGVPAGWSPASTTGTAPGYFTASAGTRSVSSGQMVVSGLTLAGGATLTIVYGSKTLGGPGATSPATGAVQSWSAKERSSGGGTMTALGSGSPVVTVLARDGSGTMSVLPASVRSNTSGNTLTFTYTAASGGISNGAVAIGVPAGWSPASTTGTDAGYFTASAGTRSVSSGQMVVSGLTLAGGAKLTIVYGSKAQSGPGATSPATGGVQSWPAKERSSGVGTMSALVNGSPAVTVLARDGSGTMSVSPTTVVHGSTGQTLVFTYTAASGGMLNGSVTLAVPAGWSAPSTAGAAAGYTAASTGTVSVSGQTITVSGVTRTGGASLTITYGSKALGGPGATPPATAVGAQTWQAKQRSSSTGVLTNLAASPSVNVT
jgi:subtilisin family serine protease